MPDGTSLPRVILGFAMAMVASVLVRGVALAQDIVDYPQWPDPQYGHVPPEEAATGILLVDGVRRQWRLSRVRASLLFPAARSGTAPLPAGGGRATPVSGEAASAEGWSLWKSGEWSRLKDVRTGQRRRGHAVSGTLGLERSLGDAITLGASVGLTHTSLKTLFNSGHSRVFGVTLTPYVAVTPTDWLTVTISGGYVHNHERLDWASAGGVMRGHRSSDGYTVSAVAEAGRWFDSVLYASLRTGVVASGDNWDAFTDSAGVRHAAVKERLVQTSVEGTLSLWLDPLMPSLSVAYTRDLKRVKRDSDRDDVTITGGVAWYGSGAMEGVSLDLSASAILGRRSQRNVTISLGARIAF